MMCFGVYISPRRNVNKKKKIHLYFIFCDNFYLHFFSFFSPLFSFFSDLFVGLLNVLTDIVWRITVSWRAGNAACKAIKFSQACVTYASTYVLVALSIDRYDAITHPMNFSGSCKWRKWRRRRWQKKLNLLHRIFNFLHIVADCYFCFYVYLHARWYVGLFVWNYYFSFFVFYL